MQILHCPDHWVLVAHGMLGCRIVTVYDTLQFNPRIRQQALAWMSSLTRTDEPSMTYQVAPCMRQAISSNDCGFLAIAFAVSLAFDLDPCSYIFHSKDLRLHLKECFERDQLTPFPGEMRKTLKRSITMMSESVIWTCRRTDFQDRKKTDSDWDVATCYVCRKKFHRMCVKNFPTSMQRFWTRSNH